MSATHYKNILFPKALFLVLVLVLSPSVAWGVNISSDTTVSDDLTTQHTFTADDITLTVTGSIKYSGKNPILGNQNPGRTNPTIVVNSGASIETVGAGTNIAVNLTNSTGATVTNSGTISAVYQVGIRALSSTNATITNNAGGVISAANNTILAHNASVSGLTITNSGKIYNTGGEAALRIESSSGTTVTNNAGGEIYTTGSG